MARRDTALQASAWLIIALTMGGVGVFAWRTIAPLLVPVTAVVADRSPPPALHEPMTACRRAAAEAPETGKWVEVEDACGAAIRASTDHSEALMLFQSARHEAACARALEKAQKLFADRQFELADRALSGVRDDCTNWAQGRQLVPKVLAEAAAECRRLAQEGNWEVALDPCELYVERTYCPDHADAFTPPKGKVLELRTRLTANQKQRAWKPKDSLLIDFFTARHESGDDDVPWSCPVQDDRAAPLGETPAPLDE